MNSCTVCKLPVLELDGQFENLEPYYAEPDHPAAALAGECHSSCIAASPHGPTWFEWRVRNYSTNRGYRIAAERDSWTILVHRRHPELLAFHSSGFSVGVERQSRRSNERTVEGEVLLPVDEEFNLALDHPKTLADLKTHLKTEGRYSILVLLDTLGIADRLQWPQALESAEFVLDPKLQRKWTSTAISMRARYAMIIPAPVVPFWRVP